MGSFPYTPSLVEEGFSQEENNSIEKKYDCSLTNIATNVNQIDLYEISGDNDDNLVERCLRGLCEREMIKGGEFLLIFEVSVGRLVENLALPYLHYI